MYEQARDQVLRTNPPPDLDEALAIIRGEESNNNWWALKTIVFDNQRTLKKPMTLFPYLGLDLYHQRYLMCFVCACLTTFTE